ncbi:hypothetical protein P691DRAFT_623018, partial [Macrolepiota fuliginosa MF-IS2]
LHHPIRIVIILLVFRHVDKIRILLDQNKPNSAGMASFWKGIWDILQPESAYMWAPESGCVAGTSVYVEHMLASGRLGDKFEDRGEVD